MAAQPVKRRRRRGEAGFTLIEIMIAMVLTAIAIMGIIALYVTSTKASSFSRHSTEAANLAQERYEMQRTIAPVTWTGTTASDGLETGLDAGGNLVAGGMFTRKTVESITNLPGNTPPKTWADITVTVSWAEDGVNRQVVVAGRRGL